MVVPITHIPPFLTIDELGQPPGYNADIARAINQQSGIPIEFREHPTFRDGFLAVVSGEATGFAVEVMSDLGRKLGIKINYIPISREQFAQGPQPNTYDALPSVGVSAARREIMDFAYPIETAEYSIFYRADEGYAIEDYEAYMSALTQRGNITNPVVWFETGQEAINYLHRTGEYQGAQHKMPAIVFLDLNLPGMEGRDFLSKLKSSEKTKHLPVVVMTS